MNKIIKIMVCMLAVVVAASGCGLNKSKNNGDNANNSISNMKKIEIFEGSDIKGDPVNKSILERSRYTLINVWSPSCGPCRDELSVLKKVNEDYKDRGLNIVGVVYDGSSAKMSAYKLLRENGITYENIIPSEKFMTDFVTKEKATPYSKLVDNKGTIKKYIVGAVPYDGFKTILDELIK